VSPPTIFNYIQLMSFCTLQRIASIASFTSCTRRILAPFVSAMVFKTVVPFNASSGASVMFPNG
jgi:hypothetical protein